MSRVSHIPTSRINRSAGIVTLLRHECQRRIGSKCLNALEGGNTDCSDENTWIRTGGPLAGEHLDFSHCIRSEMAPTDDVD